MLTPTPLQLVVVHSPGAGLLGRTFPMPVSDAITVGRSPKNSVVLQEEAASRFHARFELRNSAWWVVDLGSTNGVLVNDVPEKRALLRDGDVIRVGGTLFRLCSAEQDCFDDRHIFERSLVDGLTGLPNRRHGRVLLQDALERSCRDGSPLALALLDLDRFKRINDTLGHMTGDSILRGIAATLRGLRRPGDTVARFGGEEFLWWMPGTEPEDALALAEGLRHRIEVEGVVVGEQTISLTASVGLARRGDQETDPLGLLGRADEAVVEAKRGGRNRVVARW